ncbi:MAG: MFS transporter [Bacteroidales bacterium]
MRHILHNLSAEEKKTFILHLVYSVIEGIILGILALNEYVLIKSLNGTNMQIGLLFQFGSVVLLFSILLNEWIRRSLNKARLIRWLAWITRVPLLLMFFFPHSPAGLNSQQLFGTVFLFIFLLFYLANPIIYPIINLLLKSNYRHDNFGPLYSYATGVNKLVMLGATLVFGIWLDINPFVFTLVYPVMAVLGIGSIYILSLIPYEEEKANTLPRMGIWKSTLESIRNMSRIFRINKAYRDFETGFNLYGFAWMITVAVITIYFDKELHLSYSSVAFYKNSYNLISILLFPFFGRLIGKIDPRKFAIYTFLSLFVYFFFLMLTRAFPGFSVIAGIQIYYMLIPAFLSHAVFAATMGLIWYIGSAYFSQKSEAADYQSIHLSMTGIRALYGPILGVLFYQWFGITLTFIFAMAALLIAIFVMHNSMRKHPI